jgi:hypothetical protein
MTAKRPPSQFLFADYGRKRRANQAAPFLYVMPALVASIHVFLRREMEVVDDRVSAFGLPGHDEDDWARCLA